MASASAFQSFPYNSHGVQAGAEEETSDGKELEPAGETVDSHVHPSPPRNGSIDLKDISQSVLCFLSSVAAI